MHGVESTEIKKVNEHCYYKQKQIFSNTYVEIVSFWLCVLKSWCVWRALADIIDILANKYQHVCELLTCQKKMCY